MTPPAPRVDSTVIARRQLVLAAAASVAVGLLSACSGAATTIRSTATPATATVPPSTPVVVVAPSGTPTPQPAATDTPAPAATAESTVTAAPTDTVAPTATAAATLTPAPAATATPVATATPLSATDALNHQFGSFGWDFSQRPVLFQIDNAQPAWPQSGLSSAYVVYETLAEGGITRFSALTVQKQLSTAGNLRSARLIDLDLVPQWNAVLVHVGASTPVEQMLRQAGVDGLDMENGALSGASWRVATRYAPYNDYTSLGRVQQAMQTVGISQTVAQPRAFPIGPLPPKVQTAPATAISLPYLTPSDGRYTWDAASNGYSRFDDRGPMIDDNTGRQIVVANVIFQYAVETVTDIIEDTGGSRSLAFNLQGKGAAALFRDGTRLDITWSRAARGDLTQFLLSDGTPAPLAPGNVWIAIVPESFRTG